MTPNRLRLALPLALGLAAVLALPLEAQKSTIQGSRGGGGGGTIARGAPSTGGARGGIARPSTGGARGGVARPSTPSRPSGGTLRPGGSTLSPDFPRKGRNEQPSVVTRPSSGGDRRSTVSRPSGGSQGLGRVTRPGDDKRYLRPSGGDRRWVGDEWKRSHRRRNVTYVFADPFFFHDPFLRYRYYDRYRYAFGFGCGFYDRHWWGVGGWGVYPYGRYDPCFSSFSVAFGHPWFVDPWPGFWSWGFYGRGGYGSPSSTSGWSDGYDEGYSRGYRDGRATGEVPAPYVRPEDGPEYGVDVEPYGGAAPDPGLPLDPAVRRYLGSGQYAAALAELDRMLGEYPGDPAAHLARGITLAALGHYGKAAEALGEGLDAGGPARLSIDAPALFSSRAEFRRVVNDLETHVRTHADSRDARLTLGALYLFSGEIDSGRALLRGLGDDRHARALLERTGVS